MLATSGMTLCRPAWAIRALLSLLALILGAFPLRAEEGGESLPNGVLRQRLQVGGQERHYLLYVPPQAENQALPLVLALHGGGGRADLMASERYYGLLGKARAARFVIAFPNGSSRFAGGQLATWNAGGCCGQARDRGSDDVGFLRAVVADIQRRVRIDPERIFATGMSNGGMMSYRLACEAADLFRAVASVAGTEALAECRAQRPVSILHLHARDDTQVLFEGGAGPASARYAGKIMNFVSVPENMARWVERNQCATLPQRVVEVPGVICERYSPCRENTLVQLCVTQTGGHSWPGAAAVRPGKPAASQAIQANDLIWSFFAEASQEGPRNLWHPP